MVGTTFAIGESPLSLCSSKPRSSDQGKDTQTCKGKERSSLGPLQSPGKGGGCRGQRNQPTSQLQVVNCY